MASAQTENTAPHIPVLLDPILDAVAPMSGLWIDGTFGAGGYTRAFLDAGASKVFAIDRDPTAIERAAAWRDDYGTKLDIIEGEFAELDQLVRATGADHVDGVVLDIGVSSMQIDQAERGFSFMSDGPLDMRMSGAGMSAADIVNTSDEAVIADILFQYGEERASRRIARNIVKARADGAITTTRGLAEIVENSLPRPKPGQAHPATRSFQALRIAVNDELGQLVAGLNAAEAILSPGGWLAVVSFHSLEDRIVKRFIQARSGGTPRANRYAPEAEAIAPAFEKIGRKAIEPTAEECAANPRARSAKLRLARRLDAQPQVTDGAKLGLPKFDPKRLN